MVLKLLDDTVRAFRHRLLPLEQFALWPRQELVCDLLHANDVLALIGVMDAALHRDVCPRDGLPGPVVLRQVILVEVLQFQLRELGVLVEVALIHL